MLIISCHSDTGFLNHSLKDLGNGYVQGHLDNFAGVYSVMKAYFSGRLNQDYVRIELTWGEETGDYGGAMEAIERLNPHDVVVVLDVTATETNADFVFEKCADRDVREYLAETLEGMSFEIYEDCPDPVSCYDETDVYRGKCARTFFLGVPCTGGDYNDVQVLCRRQSLDSIADALLRIIESYPRLCSTIGSPVN
jgi:hypothetical protein